MRRRIGPLLAVVAGTMLVPAAPAASGEACFDRHGEVYFRDFAGGPNPNDVPNDFYAAPEGQSAEARISPMPGCGHVGVGGTFTASFATEPGTATEADYIPVSGTTPPMCDDIDSWEEECSPVPRWRSVEVPVNADGVQDSSSVETLWIRLTGGSGGVSQRAIHTNPAPIHVVDVDGPARASLAPGADATVHPRIEGGRLRLPVFLAGSGPPGSIGFALEGEGPFPATPGVDFSCTPACPGGVGSVPVGSSRVAFVQVNLTNDGLPEQDERIRLTITSPAVASGEPASTVIEIVDLSGDKAPPVSRFHHPRQGVKYRWGAYQLREMHTFATDEGLAGVNRVELALRRKKEGGRCAWWNGRKFRPGACEARRWLRMTYQPTGDLYVYRIKPLRPTVGTPIKSYTAWTRARDTAGNLERSFDRNRNLSTFKVKRKR